MHKLRIRNVKDIVENDLCIGCGACKVACPHKAIKMNYDDVRGLPVPSLEVDLCKDCELCLRVCHSLNVHAHDVQASLIGNYINCYVGFATDQKLRFNAASGGVVTALILHALEENLIDGAILTKMETGKTPRAKPFIATSRKHVLSAIGSKYCPVPLLESLDSIDYGKDYAIVGLPCHIYAAKKLAEIRPVFRNIRLHIGLLCGGTPSYLGTQYLLKKYNMQSRYISRFEYRGEGWPGRLLIVANSSTQTEEIGCPYPDYWQGTYSYFLPFKCTICRDGFNQFSDVSCGDAWLPQVRKTDNLGTSLIITRTEAGQQLVQDASQKGIITVSPIREDEVLKSQHFVHKHLLLRAHVNVSKLLGKTIPLLDTGITSPDTLQSYIQTITFYSIRYMLSKKSLWPFYDVFRSLVRKMRGKIETENSF